MRQLKFILCLFIFAFSIGCMAATESKLVNLTIQGGDCPFCANLLLSKLSKSTGVDAVRMGDDRKRILIVMKPGLEPNMAQINAALKEAGYLTTSITKTESIKGAKGSAVLKTHIAIKNEPCENCHKGQGKQ